MVDPLPLGPMSAAAPFSPFNTAFTVLPWSLGNVQRTAKRPQLNIAITVISVRSI